MSISVVSGKGGTGKTTIAAIREMWHRIERKIKSSV